MEHTGKNASDITKVNPRDLPDVEGVVLGTPCPSWSSSAPFSALGVGASLQKGGSFRLGSTPWPWTLPEVFRAPGARLAFLYIYMSMYDVDMHARMYTHAYIYIHTLTHTSSTRYVARRYTHAIVAGFAHLHLAGEYSPTNRLLPGGACTVGLSSVARASHVLAKSAEKR